MSDEGTEELSTLAAIYPELLVDGRLAELELAVKPNEPILVQFSPDSANQTDRIDHQNSDQADAEKRVSFSNLPPLKLHIQLPEDYPDQNPPEIHINASQDWLPQRITQSLAAEATKLWEEFGRTQVLFAYIDLLQGVIEAGFDLNHREDCFRLPKSFELDLVKYDQATKQSIFNAGTYECGVCLEPKKGLMCYQLQQCKHVFCKKCLQDFYENAIKEGDVKHIECLEPDCGKDCKTKRKALHPRELLAIGIDESSVRRMVELKRKKKREADKTTVYCPRSWCQAPARSARYPPIPADLNDYVDISDDEDSAPLATDQDDRLTVCENPKCGLAFCRTCCASWHGAYVRCHPRDTTELSAEEQASYDYIRRHTSPCPTCNSPTQKTMGCNHMNCFQCNTHFCYLCAAWLDGSNPYSHFNTPGTPCFERLWELEEGDEGQGPQDGRGFGGARAWEAMALDAVREIQREEIEAAAAIDQVIQEQAQDVEVAETVPQAARRPPGRRRMYRGPAHPPAHRQPEPPLALLARDPEVDDELRRFVEMALRDEEDGWDSDGLADDDEAWRIR